MAYSQQTTHYGLPLPTSGDKSTFLDTNDAFGRIDSAIYEAKTNATAAVQDIGQIQLNISQLQASTLEMQTDISQLTSRQTISETNITALQNAMTTAQIDVTKLQNDYGNTDISDIGDGTVTGAIASIYANEADITISGNANKTMKTLINELFTAIDKSKLTVQSSIEFITGSNVYYFTLHGINTNGTILSFSSPDSTVATALGIREIIASSDSLFTLTTISANATSVTDYSANPTTNSTVKFRY